MKMTEQEYVNNNGMNCLYCGSGNISFEHESPFIRELDIIIPVECHSCKARWFDKYFLCGIQSRKD